MAEADLAPVVGRHPEGDQDARLHRLAAGGRPAGHRAPAHGVVRGLDLVREVRAATVVPVYGIGGIDAGNAVRVLQAGADGVAVARAIGDAPDPAAAAKQLLDVVRRMKSLREAQGA